MSGFLIAGGVCAFLAGFVAPSWRVLITVMLYSTAMVWIAEGLK